METTGQAISMEPAQMAETASEDDDGTGIIAFMKMFLATDEHEPSETTTESQKGN